MSLRDANVVIIETSRSTIRAGQGLHDLLKTPSIEILARVGLRKSQEGGDPKVNDYLVGSQLDDALSTNPNDIQVFWPFLTGDVSDWTQAEALWKHILFTHLHLRRLQNEAPTLLTLPIPTPSRTTPPLICQLFFERFNTPAFALLPRPLAHLYASNPAPSLSGLIIDIGLDTTDITPIYESAIVHSAKRELGIGTRVCKHYLARLLSAPNAGVVQQLFPPPSALSGELPTPPSRKKVHNTLLRLVSTLITNGHIKPPISGESLSLALFANASSSAFPLGSEEDPSLLTDIAALVVSGKEKAVIESLTTKKKLNAKATAAEQSRAREIEAMDLITVQFEGRNVTVGKERHRFCEPLFDPGVMEGVGLGWVFTLHGADPSAKSGKNAEERDPEGEEGLPPLSMLEKNGERVTSLQEAVGHSADLCDVDIRQDLWQGLFITGEVTRFVKSISSALHSRLSFSPFLATSGLDSEVQPRSIRILHVPEYYAQYRETGNGYAGFLGGSIVSKIVFNDHSARNYVSKADYTTRGPSAVIEMAPALL